MAFIRYCPAWGSKNENHRRLIRECLERQYRGQFAHDPLDLEVPPRLIRGSVSISHCETLGGYARSSHPVGFDIELITRVKEPIARRISASSDELVKAPSLAEYWCAKEAAYKMLRHYRQPQVIAEVELIWSGNHFHLAAPEKFGAPSAHGTTRLRKDVAFAWIEAEEI